MTVRTGDQLGILVVGIPGRVNRRRLIQAVRQLRGGGQHLQVNPGAVHQREPGASSAPSPAPMPRCVAVSVLPSAAILSSYASVQKCACTSIDISFLSTHDGPAIRWRHSKDAGLTI
jgi:hypothetical protein